MKTENEPIIYDEEHIYQNINDKNFKTVLQIKAEVIIYIKTYFRSLLEYIDLDKLELSTTNYVNKDFEEYFSDVVYRTELKPTVHKKKRPIQFEN